MSKTGIEIAPEAPSVVVDSQGTELKLSEVVGGRGDKGWIYNYCKPVANKPKSEAELICTLCNKRYKIKNSSLATMVLHLKGHGKLPNEQAAEEVYTQQAKSEQLQTYAHPYKKKSIKYEGRLRALTQFFYESGRPIYMADDKSFQRLLATYDPQMPRVTARQIKYQSSKLVVDKLQKVQSIMKEQLDDKLQPSVTSDIWTNKGMRDSAISFTLHFIDKSFQLRMLSLGAVSFNDSHTAENILSKLESLATNTLKFETLDIILTTDAAANMAKAARCGGLFWIRCLLHTIHLAVGRGMESIEDKQQVIDKCREVLQHFSHSQQRKSLFARVQQMVLVSKDEVAVCNNPIRIQDLQTLEDEGDQLMTESMTVGSEEEEVEVDDGVQVQMITSGNVDVETLESTEFIKNGKVLALVKDVETRWNSTYAMLQRLKQLQKPLELYISMLSSSGQRKLVEASERIRFNSIDWRQLDEILEPLQCFKEASLALEYQSKPTIHLVLNIIKQLLYEDVRLNNPDFTVEHLAFYISNAARNYIFEMMDNDIYLVELGVAAFLDPRQKSLSVINKFFEEDFNFEQIRGRWASALDFKKDIRKYVKEYAEEIIVIPAESHEVEGPNPDQHDQESQITPTPVQTPSTQVIPLAQPTPSTRPTLRSRTTQASTNAEPEAEMQTQAQVSRPATQLSKKRKIGDIDENESEDDVILTRKSSVEQEIEIYLQLDHKVYNAWKVINKNTNDKEWDILLWWKQASKQLPNLAKLARWSLAVQPTSAASERAFSGAEFINDKRRINISQTNFWQATFLKEKQQDRPGRNI